MVTISKSTVTAKIWENFYNLINAGVANPHTSGKWIYSSMPDFEIDTASDYPLMVISPVKISTEQLTMTKTTYTGTIDVEVYATSWATCDQYFDDMLDAVEGYKFTLAEAGIRNLDLADTDDDTFERGKIKLHIKKATFQFEVILSRTGGF